MGLRVMNHPKLYFSQTRLVIFIIYRKFGIFTDRMMSSLIKSNQVTGKIQRYGLRAVKSIVKYTIFTQPTSCRDGIFFLKISCWSPPCAAHRK
ncbi:hypothetical protein CTS44_12739 [Comamonas thiooxydans]|nr:hypothetical protein CTS44_12739 [Comamonas thiooxydans]